MDEKDEAIIRVLERSGKLSSRAVAERIDLPITTVYRRIRRMEKEGIILGYRAVIDYEKTQRPIGAYVFIDLEEVIAGKGHVPKRQILSKLSRFDEVHSISDIHGAEFDIVIRVRTGSLETLADLTEVLRSVEGIEEVSTIVITKEIHPKGL